MTDEEMSEIENSPEWQAVYNESVALEEWGFFDKGFTGGVVDIETDEKNVAYFSHVAAGQIQYAKPLGSPFARSLWCKRQNGRWIAKLNKPANGRFAVKFKNGQCEIWSVN